MRDYALVAALLGLLAGCAPPSAPPISTDLIAARRASGLAKLRDDIRLVRWSVPCGVLTRAARDAKEVQIKEEAFVYSPYVTREEVTRQAADAASRLPPPTRSDCAAVRVRWRAEIGQARAAAAPPGDRTRLQLIAAFSEALRKLNVAAGCRVAPTSEIAARQRGTLALYSRLLPQDARILAARAAASARGGDLPEPSECPAVRDWWMNTARLYEPPQPGRPVPGIPRRGKPPEYDGPPKQPPVTEAPDNLDM